MQKDDVIYRQAAINKILNHKITLLNRYGMNCSEKISGVKNGLQYALGHLMELPPAQPEIIRCEYCKHHHYENKDIPYCDRIDYGYGWKDDDFCSKAERREDEGFD